MFRKKQQSYKNSYLWGSLTSLGVAGTLIGLLLPKKSRSVVRQIGNQTSSWAVQGVKSFSRPKKKVRIIPYFLGGAIGSTLGAVTTCLMLSPKTHPFLTDVTKKNAQILKNSHVYPFKKVAKRKPTTAKKKSNPRISAES